MRAADTITALLEAYRGKTKLPDLQPLRDEIARLAHAAPTESATQEPQAGTQSKPERPVIRWTEYEHLAITRALEDGRRVDHVIVELDPQCGMPIAARQMLQMALADLGEVLALYPAEGSPDPSVRIEAALASEKPAEQIRAKCTIPTISKNVILSPLHKSTLTPPAPVVQEKADEPAQTHEEAMAPPSTSADAPRNPEAAAPAAAASENILRVDAERIDNVLDLVGELILAKSMLQQALIEFGQRFPKDSLRGKFSDAMAFQARVLNDLQRSVMKVRMVPVDQLFRRFPRIVRDVAHTCGKEVDLVIRGGDTDLDKTILDALAEPLTHLMRNAVGHGIETAAERVRAGKRGQGTLRLSAYHQGNQVVIEISDDGRGAQCRESAGAGSRSRHGDTRRSGTAGGIRSSGTDPAAGILNGRENHRRSPAAELGSTWCRPCSRG